MLVQPVALRPSANRLKKQGMSAAQLRPVRACVQAPQSTMHEEPESRKNPDLYTLTQELKPPSEAEAPSVSMEVSVNSGRKSSFIKPELLSPAGGWPQMIAAVENGADAVYFGLSEFNARARAENFTTEELPEVMDYLHDRGVKGYVTLNVLVFDEELQAVEDCVRIIARAGVDACIVQDLGIVELMRQVAPNLPVHGSTQMTITSAEGADFIHQLGVDRVVVGRELSLKEISKVRDGSKAEVEAFVHGALCVSYSGQCFSSEAWGGRSANRGQCAQACRMPYGLLLDGQLKEMGDMKYLLSPQDLMAVEHVPELIEAGVACFKIEGRLKGPEYVSLTTQVYRKAIDAAWEALGNTAERQRPRRSDDKSMSPSMAAAKKATKLSTQERRDLEQEALGIAVERHRLKKTAATKKALRQSTEERRGLEQKPVKIGTQDFEQKPVKIGAQERRDFEQVFARGQDGEHTGLTPGFLEGVQHQRLVRGRSPRHRGVYVGKVVSVSPRSVEVQLAGPISKGDGVVFDAGNPEEHEEGGIVHNVLQGSGKPIGEDMVSEGLVKLVFQTNVTYQNLDLGYIQPGDLVWRTRSPKTEARLKETYNKLSSAQQLKIPIDVQVTGELDQPLTLTLRDDAGRTCSASTSMSLTPASKRPMAVADITKAIGQLGPNCLDTKSLDTSGLKLDQGLFLPSSELKAVRREAADSMLALRRDHRCADGLAEEPVLPRLMAAATQSASSSAASSTGRKPVRKAAEARHLASLRVLCRSKEQVEAACTVEWLGEIVLDFLEVQGLKEAVASVKEAGKRAVVATPRILKPDEERLWNFYLKLGSDALLVRSLGLLHKLQTLGGTGAHVPSLGLTIPVLEGDFSLNTANTLTADLLLRKGGLARLTPTHDLNAGQLCALAQNLDNGLEGTMASNGHPCETSQIHLRDHQGKDHLVLADMGCRNTVFNAQAQSGLFFLPEFLKAGYSTFRIELVDEPAELVVPLLEGYRDTMLGNRGPGDMWKWMQQGLTDANGRAHGIAPGSLEVVEERARKSLRPTAATLKNRK
eukprot:gene14799-20854_t